MSIDQPSTYQKYMNNYYTPSMSTTDDYNRLTLLVTKLELTVGSLMSEIQTLKDMCNEELESHSKATIALGEVIKGLGDRIEDVEHEVDFKVSTL